MLKGTAQTSVHPRSSLFSHRSNVATHPSLSQVERLLCTFQYDVRELDWFYPLCRQAKRKVQTTRTKKKRRTPKSTNCLTPGSFPHITVAEGLFAYKCVLAEVPKCKSCTPNSEPKQCNVRRRKTKTARAKQPKHGTGCCAFATAPTFHGDCQKTLMGNSKIRLCLSQNGSTIQSCFRHRLQPLKTCSTIYD